MGFDVRGEPREKEEEEEVEEEEEEMGVQVESSSSHGSDMAKERLSLTIYKVVQLRHGRGMVVLDNIQGFSCSEKVHSAVVQS